MSQAAQLNQFLAEVEKRAFYMARAAVKSTDDALDIVQDTMFTLARKYADKPPEQWRPLFFRILQNRIRDWHRRASVKRRLFWSADAAVDEEAPTPFDSATAPASVEPDSRSELDGATRTMLASVAELPLRQQQAFLLRTLEGMSVAETASTMKCSQGSVKTHYSRAVHTLRDKLEEHWR